MGALFIHFASLCGCFVSLFHSFVSLCDSFTVVLHQFVIILCPIVVNLHFPCGGFVFLCSPVVVEFNR